MSVPAQRLRPFVEYLTGVYDSLEEVSEISGIELTLLHKIKESDDYDVEANSAQRIVDFLLAHKRKSSDIFYSFEDKDTTARFPSKDISDMRDKEVKMLRSEKKRKGW